MAKKVNNNFDPRLFMELAIEEMRKSKNEPRPDGKVPPKVGAVILFPDGRVEKAYRGELRDGDHAEYTLIERKLVDEDLSDCILFTTLEPCVSRNDPKIPCCKRTTKARIKKVYVGIEDKDPTVDGKGIRHLLNNKVEVKMFPKDLQKIIEKENADFLKQALDRKHKKEKEDLQVALEKPVSTFDVSKFSEEALQKFLAEAQLPYRTSDKDFLEFLADFGALVHDEKTNNYKATGFGILLFGKNPRTRYPQAVLKAHVKYGDGKIEPKDFDQALVLIPDLLEQWLHKVLPLAKDTSSFKRKDVPNFPIKVLREAVINALVHRDYDIKETGCTLEIDNNKITVKSPGKPLPSISLEELNSFEAPSLRRNPILTYVFSLMDYVEEKGFGMDTFKSLNKEFGLPLPVYKIKEPFLTLTFPRSLDNVVKVSGRAALGELTEEELKGYEWIRSEGEISAKEYTANFGITKRTTSRHLSKMLGLKLVQTNDENPKSPKLRYKAT